ncbi:MAG: TIGR02757 family protein [Chitinophagales bacterium]|nr:TIGR02757 family protein [Chitinophagales bacterium]
MLSARNREILEEAYLRFHNADFIQDDPLQVPHHFSKKQDIEIMAFFAATLAWGQRKTIIKNCWNLVEIFENEPHNFIVNHQEEDLKKCLKFKHRTFNPSDLLYFISFLKQHYEKNESLESAFSMHLKEKEETVQNALIGFHNYFCSLDYFPSRTRKHIASPARNSACKRLNMFLRWMVRKDEKNIDFGIWKDIQTWQLLCPLDVHVERQARILGLIQRPQRDFKTVLELSKALKTLDPIDPVKYDFALFGLGIHAF